MPHAGVTPRRSADCWRFLTKSIGGRGGTSEPRRTPLHVLCRRGCPRGSTSSTASDAAPPSRSSATAVGDLDAWTVLQRSPPANLGATDAVDYTPLHFSASRADVEMVSLLIQAGVNVVHAAPPPGFTSRCRQHESFWDAQRSPAPPPPRLGQSKQAPRSPPRTPIQILDAI